MTENNASIKSFKDLPKPIGYPGYKPTRPKLAKTVKVSNCLNCDKELPAPKRLGGRNREFCSEKCRVAYNRAYTKSTNQILSVSLTTETQLMGYEKLGFSKETMDTLRTIATYYPQSQSIGGKYPWDAAELAVNAIITEKKNVLDKLVESLDDNIKTMKQAQALSKELEECKAEIKRLKGEKDR